MTAANDGSALHDLPIRPAALADVPALRALVESGYRGDSARRGWTHEADLLGGQRTDEAALSDLLADPRQTVLIAWDGAEPVACVQVSDEGDGYAYLGLLTVRPDLQAAGLGRRLIAAAEAHARKVGARIMAMTVIALRTELITWYERRGYRLTGATKPFPLDDERFGLPRRRDLDFVVLEKPLG